MFWKKEKILESYDRLPEVGIPKEEVLKKLTNYLETDLKGVETDKFSGAIYADDTHQDLVKEATNMYIKVNNLHSTTYSNCLRMENEIGRFLTTLYNGGFNARGLWTPGGSYSNILACYCAREHAYAQRFVHQPEMIMCTNAHPSLEKGAKICKMKVHMVPTGSDYRIDVRKVVGKINSSTALIVCSAPDYPRGVIDNIELIARECVKRNIWLHVDGCLGSLVTPFLKDNNYELFSRFDFSVEGVRSISCDTHKYGLGPKGTSYLLFKDFESSKYAGYATTVWDGGILPSVSFEGSKPGYVIAATWAVMMHYGYEGYKLNSYLIKEKVDYLVREISKIPALYMQGSADVCVVAFGCKSKRYNVYQIRNKMSELGWYIKEIQNPPGIHIAVTMNNINRVKSMVKDLLSVIGNLEKMTDEEIEAMGSGIGIYGLKDSFGGKIKLDIGMELAIDSMSGFRGLWRDEVGTITPENSKSQLNPQFYSAGMHSKGSEEFKSVQISKHSLVMELNGDSKEVKDKFRMNESEVNGISHGTSE